MNEQEARTLRTKIREVLDDYLHEPLLLILGIPTEDHTITTLHATGVTMGKMAEMIGIQLGQVMYDNMTDLRPYERIALLMDLADEIKECIVQAIALKRAGIHLNEGARK